VPLARYDSTICRKMSRARSFSSVIEGDCMAGAM
jgi:hypothetical protein